MNKKTQIRILVDAANRGIAARQMLQELFPKETEVELNGGETLPLSSPHIDWARTFRHREVSNVKNRKSFR